MSFKLNGKIASISPAVQVSEKFSKREFVIETTEDMYPQHIQFQVTKDNITALDKFAVGSAVTVNFNVRGRQWTGADGQVKTFNTLEAWRIEGGQPTGNRPQPSTNQAPLTASQSVIEEEDDDLPF